MKILIALPFHGKISKETKRFLAQIEEDKTHDYYIFTAESSDLVLARNLLVHKAKDYDKVLTLDDDMGPDISDLFHLISLKKRVVSLPYIMKGRDDLYECGRFDEKVATINFPVSEKGLKTVPYNGCGFCLYDSIVLVDKYYPWYVKPVVNDSTNRFGRTLLGEDAGFAKYLGVLGINIWVDFDRPVRHMSSLPEQTNEQNSGSLLSFEFQPNEVQAITDGLVELPYKVANPIIQNISKQLRRHND